MAKRATGTFEIKGWNEDTYQELDGGGKLTRASVTQAFHGDLEGEGAVEYLMAYRPDGTANFVGLQRVVGRLGQKSGSFVLQTSGTYDGTEAKATWSVVPGSGSGDLAGLKGEGGYAAPHGPQASVTLDYDFE